MAGSAVKALGLRWPRCGDRVSAHRPALRHPTPPARLPAAV